MTRATRFLASLLVAAACGSAAPAVPQRPAARHYYNPAHDLGALFPAVQLSGIFPDSKTFVDARPRIAPEERKKGNITNSRMVINACRPFHWREQFSPVTKARPEIQRRAREKFGYLLD